jgi:hypothetical protein
MAAIIEGYLPHNCVSKLCVGSLVVQPAPALLHNLPSDIIEPSSFLRIGSVKDIH